MDKYLIVWSGKMFNEPEKALVKYSKRNSLGINNGIRCFSVDCEKIIYCNNDTLRNKLLDNSKSFATEPKYILNNYLISVLEYGNSYTCSIRFSAETENEAKTIYEQLQRKLKGYPPFAIESKLI